MEEVHLKIDSKGRLCIPAEIREEIGDVAILKKTSKGYLIVPGKKEDFLEEFRKLITSEPRRTGKPEFWPPSKMKDIWGESKQ
jgi:bifunctional DNA-binding transcriptional regulator/antitoxin component of YhaV-PrlF toxin-antitoxin module